MTALSRTLISATAGLVLIGLAGCSGGAAGSNGRTTTEQPPTSSAAAAGLKDFDTCAFFTQGDLSAAGVKGPGQKAEQLSFEPGCSYRGEKILLTLYKNAEETVDKYESDGHWDKYEKFSINGRNAARAVEGGGGAVDAGCSIVLDAGDGVVLVDVTEAKPGSVSDKCGEAEKIARHVEPRLPK
ncbi:DUF3558 domain-containing protein [Saccharopolyspora phatthalungensis]|uniref:DUF3558 domain-containing protein n=1 Tax=Saccharopolyspora phatthalungensis TaxID=664693 RepID=A0A840Q281_9PSEU|nr:DUF3558 domain-containing protein [Saccharopolyspora phatthalungensis]MBB5152878.1 hypothetical protein [Saccharopolyspora phatthalungensis]